MALALLAFALAGHEPARAQSSPGAPPVDELVVTAGKAHPDDASISPVTSISADQIALSSATTLERLVQSLPDMGFEGVNAANGGGFGVDFIDLRNLNFNRTLTVVDGYRSVVSGIKTDEAVDLNTLPLALIDHVEILRAGSEPLYGADAVAGAVNVSLKKSFDGLRLDLFGGGATRGGDGTGSVEVTWGRNFQRGNVTLDLGYSRRDPIGQSSRDFAADPVTSATIGPGGAISTIVGAPATPGGHAVSADGRVNDVIYGTGPGQYRTFDPATDSYNFAQAQDLQGGLQRETANLLARYEIAPRVTASLQVLFTDHQSALQLAPQIVGLAGTLKHPEGFVVPAGAGGNPFGAPVELQRVMTEVGPLEPDAEGPVYRIVAGLEGRVGRFDWTVAFDHGESATTFRTYNAVNLTKALQLAACDPGTGCQSADFFGPGSLTAAAANFIRYTDVSRSDYTEDVGQFSFRTTFGRLPGGPVTARLGGELRWETGDTRMDPVDLAGDQAAPDTADTGGGYHAREVWLDLSWPLLAGRRWARSFDLDTAVRYTHFNLFGGYPTWKIAASYAPNETLRLRATVGLARRQPAITEAFAGLSAGLTAVQDPCDSVSGLLGNPVVAANCAAQGLSPHFVQASPLINIASGGDPHLKPETSHNLTAGVALTPRFAPGLTATADYYRYHVENAIDSLADADANFIPDGCYESVNLSSPLCALIQRTALGPNAGQINRILALDSNISEILTDGFDLGLTYHAVLAPGVTLDVDWQTNDLLDYIVGEAGVSTQYAGYFASLTNTGTYTKLRSLMSTTLGAGPWTFGWTVRYTGGAKVLGQDASVTPFAAATWRHDLVVSFHRGPLTYALGADNVTDRRPPLLLDGQSNTNLNTYDVVGAFVYFRVSAKL